MVMEFELLPRQPFALGQFIRIADVMVGTDEKRVVGIVEK